MHFSLGLGAKTCLVSAEMSLLCDPDGIVRPGMIAAGMSPMREVGIPSTGWTPVQMTVCRNCPWIRRHRSRSHKHHTMGRRPLVLNRPFRSVGELGYVSRSAFKTLDFFTAYSADAALLDVFSLTDQPAVVSGQINPNTAPAPGLQAILSGGGKQEAFPPTHSC